jgi:hypothetical protein
MMCGRSIRQGRWSFDGDCNKMGGHGGRLVYQLRDIGGLVS